MEQIECLKTDSFSWLDTIKNVWHFLGKEKSKYVFVNALIFGVFFYDLVPPLVVGKIVDFFTFYQKGQPLKTFYFYIIFLGVSYSVAALIRLKSRNVLSKIGINVKTKTRISGFEKLINLPLYWNAKENTGGKMEKISTGSQALQELISMPSNNILPIVVSFVGIFSILAFLSPIFMVFAACYLIVFFTVQRIFSKKILRLTNQCNLLKQSASGTYVEETSNIMSIKALGTEKNARLRVKEAEDAVKKLQFKQELMGTRKWYCFQILTGLSYIIFFFIIGKQVLAGIITVGEIFVFYSYLNKLREAGNKSDRGQNFSIEQKSNLANMLPIFLEKAKIKTGSEDFPKKWDAIEIKDGEFSYDSKDQPALKGVNLKIEKNETLGIAGASGSGKSTLIKIILGLYKLEKGEFKIGAKNYYDIAHDKLIENVSVVLQETELFNLSLKDNLTGTKEISDSLLESALTVAKLNELVDSLPDGLETIIGEKGYKLSGGERQRIGIARAICKDAPIIILDEATSSLDSKTEKTIMGELTLFAKNKTLLIISHQISNLKTTDRVIVFDEGKIKEEGEYLKLIRDKKSKLNHLYKLQK